eukprot:CAMPEP_0179943446 /NCGR_PEP_ID=MMETSP0983-20121128/18306_1 /TAXON_ID=483367 /ORGANISM="non described non described, Strain CCMP 2436" /LENGTH=587 /DNA_ID=CAMNT_0021851119 /DNA_START=186 /DNA_END=1949 /DNA_ORIENTATION=-
MRSALLLAAFLATIRAEARHDSCWVDRDTPAAESRTYDVDGQPHELIMSDEFEDVGREFSNGLDKRWTALNKSDYTNGSPMRYMPEAVTTVLDRGAFVRTSPTNESIDEKVWRDYAHPYKSLRITTSNITDNARLSKAVNKTFSGGMLQSWNKFCFTGGIVEISVKMPSGAGHWPALWLFGNLGRATFSESNDGLWPYSLSDCDEEYENMDVPEPGLKQKISGCNPNPGFGLHPNQGRGATEIDIVEAADSKSGFGGWLTMSLQVAPSIPQFFRPSQGKMPTGYRLDENGRWFLDSTATHGKSTGTWYHGLRFGGNESLNPSIKPFQNWYGAPYADAVASVMEGLPDLSERYRKYRLEWQEGDGGHLRWFVDDEFAFEISVEALGKYTACGQAPTDPNFVCEHTPKRTMPSEPMSIVLNAALGTWNGGSGGAKGSLPGHMYIDYVRVWQRADRKNVGCDPPDFPTKEYIDGHPKVYGEAVFPKSEDSCEPIYPRRTRGLPISPSTGFPSGGGGHVALGLFVVFLILGAAAMFAHRLLRARTALATGPASSHYSSVIDGVSSDADRGSSMRAPILGRTNGRGPVETQL